jgi:hypothetical protein
MACKLAVGGRWWRGCVTRFESRDPSMVVQTTMFEPDMKNVVDEAVNLRRQGVTCPSASAQTFNACVLR